MPAPTVTSASRSGGVFISYRRDDTAGFAGRLYDSLLPRFGPQRVFMDVDAIRPGQDFSQALQDAVARADVLLAIIGPAWLTVTDPATHQRRIDNPGDFVRLEIQAALDAGKLVIPVLVQGVVMPKPADLPEPLRPLAYRNAVEISHGRWRTDVDQLVAGLPGGAMRRTTGPRLLLGAGAAVIAALVVAVIVPGLLGGRGSLPPGSSTAPTTSPSGPAASAGASSIASAPAMTGDRIIYSRQVFAADDPPDRRGCSPLPQDAKLYVADPKHPEQAPYRLTAYSNLEEVDAAWSADGSRLAILGTSGTPRIGLYVVGADGAQVDTWVPPALPNLSRGAQNRLAIAPDGRAVVHAGDDVLWQITDARRVARTIAGVEPPANPDDPPAEPTELFRDAVYASDGGLRLLMSPPDGTRSDWLEAAATDGSKRQRLDLDLSGLSVMGIALGQDDDLLAIEAIDHDQPVVLIGRISKGRTSFKPLDVGLTGVSRLAFSPDDREVAFQAGLRGSEQVYRVSVTGGAPIRVSADDESIACGPTWRTAPPDLAPARPAPSEQAVRRFELGLLAQGAYLNDIVQPTMTLTMPDGWYARRSYVDGWAVSPREGSLGEVGYGRIQVAGNGPCGTEGTATIGPKPLDLVTFLRQRKDLVISDPSPVNLGGSSGLAFEVRGRAGKQCADYPDSKEWSLFRIGQDGFGIADAEQVRVLALDVRGTTVSIYVDAYHGDLQAFLDAGAQAVVQGLTFPSP